MTYQGPVRYSITMPSKEVAQEEVIKLINKIENINRKEDVIYIMKEIMKFLPKSTDIGITIGELGKMMYVLSYDGLYSIMAITDEYLPFMTSNEKRIPIDSINENITNLFIKNRDNIVKQLREILSL